jgi:hypothetical protein
MLGAIRAMDRDLGYKARRCILVFVDEMDLSMMATQTHVYYHQERSGFMTKFAISFQSILIICLSTQVKLKKLAKV